MEALTGRVRSLAAASARPRTFGSPSAVPRQVLVGTPVAQLAGSVAWPLGAVVESRRVVLRGEPGVWTEALLFTLLDAAVTSASMSV